MFQKLKSLFRDQAVTDFDHQKPENWIWGFVYFNKNDHRLLVPKRNQMMGWTFNFAHPMSYIVLILIFIIASFGPILFKPN